MPILETVKALQIIESSPMDEIHDGAVFFAGKRNRQVATHFCSINREHMTMLDTDLYRQLREIPLFGQESVIPLEEAVDISALASVKFAQAASGNVVSFFDKVSDRSTFFTIELPALLLNDKVTTINGTPKLNWIGYVQKPILPRTDVVPPEELRFDVSHLRPQSPDRNRSAVLRLEHF